MRQFLAIIGDPDNSQRIIELLTELGNSTNPWGYKATCDQWCYCIGDKDHIIRALSKSDVVLSPYYKVMTYDEFNQKYPYKPGQNVDVPGSFENGNIQKREWAPIVGDMMYMIKVEGESAPQGAIGWWYHNALIGENECVDSAEMAGNFNECRDFGYAIKALKAGYKVTRAGWNGKGMYLWLKPGTAIHEQYCKDPILKSIAAANGGTVEGLGTICMKTADNKVLTGWLASQTDMLAEDWKIV